MDPAEKARIAREKLQKKFGKSNRMGGKGSMRINRRNRSNKQGSSNQNVKNLVQKLNAQKLPEISKINMFTKDNEVIQFDAPEVFGSFPNKTIIFSGEPDKKNINDCLADVISELSPEQLKQVQSNVTPVEDKKEEEEKPKLVNFEDEAQKQLI